MTALKKLAALFLSIAMVCSMSLNVFAVTGSTLAADGTYSGDSSEGTVTVTVSNGKIANVSANVKSKYQSYISSAFSSVIGKAATANNIDAVSSATKHMNAIKSGAKSAIASAPAADGSSSGDDSGGESGGGSGSGQSETEYTIAVGGTQELSVIEDGNYSYSWASSDTSKVSISGSGYTVTVKGESATESPVTVTCTYGFMGIDISGSIVGKEAALNSAIQSLVKDLPENSQVGIVTFNETASMSRIYSPDTISGLTFSGVEDAGTTMAVGISAATSLFNGSGWSDASNNKAMVIISDFDIDDYCNSINNARTAKTGGTTIYSVKIDADVVPGVSRTELTTDYRNESSFSVTRYISSQYPSASAVNNSMLGMFNQALVTPGSVDNSAAYVYGAGGGNWSDIFAEIKATEGITEESTEPMKNVTIMGSFVGLCRTFVT